MLNITVPANATGLPDGRLLPFDPATSTLLSTAQLLDLLGGRDTVEATIEGLIGLLDDIDAPEEDREPSLGAPENSAGPPLPWGSFGHHSDGHHLPWSQGNLDDREDEDEHGTDIDRGEADDADDEPYLSVVEWQRDGDNWRRSGRPTDIEEVNEDGDVGCDPRWWERSAHPLLEADHV